MSKFVSLIRELKIEREIVFVACLSVAAALADLLGLGTLFLVLSSVIERSQDRGESLDLVGQVVDGLSLGELGLAICLVGLLRFSIQFGYLALSSKFLFNVEASLRAYISKLLVENPYVLSSIDSDLIRTTLITLPVRIRESFLSPFFILVVELSFLFVVMIVGIMERPVFTLGAVLTVSSLGFLWWALSKRRFVVMAEHVAMHERLFQSISSEFIAGFGEMRLLGGIVRIVKRFENAFWNLAKSQRRLNIWTGLPRFILENSVLFGLGICLIIFALSPNFSDPSNYTFFLAFGVLAVRLVPMGSRLATAISLFKTGRTYWEAFSEAISAMRLALSNKSFTGRASFQESEAILNLEEVTIVVNGKVLFDPLSFVLRSPGLVAIKGPSGVGKSTLLLLLANLLKDSTDIQIGFSSQNPAILASNLESNLFVSDESATSNSAVTKIILESALYLSLKKELDGNRGALDIQGLNLSGGQRKRIGLLRALLNSRAICFLDEPDSGLDPIQIGHLETLLTAVSEELLVIVTSHGSLEIQWHQVLELGAAAK